MPEGQNGQGGESAGGVGGLPSPDAATGPKLAKEAAKAVAKEIGSAASEEAKDLGMAATRKLIELGERRRQRKAEKSNATEAAMRLANEHGLDIDQIEGSGADGRITVRDVKEAAES
jgi:pyruvate/2-oxoglutarate dehydrogenase complex dihydrolipoamide acyltransferase (E2) component